MSLSTDQVINVWNAVGTWVAGLATTGAVIVSLWLASRQSRVKLYATIGVRSIVGNGEHIRNLITLSITNLGERPVRVDSVSWKFPPAKSGYKFGMQNFGGPYSETMPKEVTHGERATFTYSDEDFKWSKWLLADYPEATSERWLKRLRLHINTSVNQTVVIKPERTLIERIKEAAADQR
ncbi:hypothetical protein [Dyella sp. GSA-30]|jgi:hypothetical protein|uniref:hypothetical protein n=1 Tax=Dyella sp. GSA-30 TaxID=2994496 RepID=UPI0024922579|nr:hypothetical protein [Dyella sp. GSA-30]BDU22508.1 hypothetical protein DYGSA30_39650 [Dyella sp. GSA-30]